MRKITLGIFFAMLTFIAAGADAYGFTSGSTGADGTFNPTSSIEVQMPTDGIFNYTTVNIPSGVTVTYKKNAANTPLYVLATGNVTIAGTLSANGKNGISITPGAGGPAGFDGGYGGTNNEKGGRGMGPGGGKISTSTNSTYNEGGGGGYGTEGNTFSSSNNTGAGGSIYGNDKIIPFIGGSGGAGNNSYSSSETGGGGGGGGGAILIASSGTINITGSLTTIGGGGDRGSAAHYGGGGSGGAIKLMASTIAGNGTISAAGGTPVGSGPGSNGGTGRIRIEADTINRTATTTPSFTIGMPSQVFVAGMPTLTITSIAGVNAPTNALGLLNSPDITLPPGTTSPVAVNLSATNIPLGTVITVTVAPMLGAGVDISSTALSGTLAASTASANVDISLTYNNVIYASASFTIQTAMNYEGEEIDRMKVATSLGGQSNAVYITKAGREIPAEQLMASLNAR